VSERKPLDPDFAMRVRSSFARQQAMRTIGARLVSVAPGEVVVEFSHDLSLTQQNGYIHAGILTTAVDSACGYAAFTLMPSHSEVLTIEYKVNFMAPASGDTFRCTGKVIKSGRTITVCTGEVVALDGGQEKVVACMQATMICLVQ
jgi:uncharacterized protein (TIGR00369 family)